MRLLSAIAGPVYGGVHTQVVRLHGPLAARGWELICLLPDEPGSAEERISAAGVEIVKLPMHRVRAQPNPLVHARWAASLWPEVGAIRRLIRERDIDVVQAHGPTNPQAALAGDREGRGVVWQIPDTRAPVPLRRLAMPVVTRVADVVTTVGMELARSHPGALSLGDRHRAILPPVMLDEFDWAAARRAAARAELRVEGDAPVVGTLANRNPSKGHEYLIRAATLVREQRPDAVFRALGAPSPPHPEYEAMLQDELRRRGLDTNGVFRFVDPGTRVPELLPALDVFVLASVPRSEGVPTVILEAMACGLPVVATDVGAVREVVDHGRTGLVIPPERSEPLAEAVLRLIEDADLRRAMGEAGRERALAEFGIDTLADQHVEIYELALAHRRSRR